MLSDEQYTSKFSGFADKTLFEKLTPSEQAFIHYAAFSHRFTFQEFREIVEASRDLSMWRMPSLESLWQALAAESPLTGRALKKRLIQSVRTHLHTLRAEPTDYSDFTPDTPAQPEPVLITEQSGKSIFGRCPVASDRTLCCRLWTLDAVERCPFGCSYCTIQTFYSGDIVFDSGFKDKLAGLKLDPDRFYHIGTGQSSDSLVFGNRNGMLDTLCRFAETHPNILLELKTKSDRTDDLLRCSVPNNLVVSWSLNPQVIIDAEEHYTASLNDRLIAARRVADQGISVAFHFHPMIYYRGWKHGYREIAERIMQDFSEEEVLFLTFGSVTLIKPVIQKIRERGADTRILQMEMVPDPHGKFTVPDAVKIALFSHMYRLFEPWNSVVFIYLCMEKSSIWKDSFGYAYADNTEFEADFARRTLGRVRGRSDG